MNRDLLQIIAVINARLAMISELKPLVEEAKDLIRNYFELAQVKLYLLDEEGEYLRLGAESLSLATGEGLVVQAAKAGEPLFDEDLQQFAIPLISNNSLLGILELYCTQWRPLAYEDILAVTIVANQVAMSLGQVRAKLHEELEVERLRALMAFNVAFLDNIAHDLRTPLGSVTGWAKVILDGMDGQITEEVRDHISIIYRAGMQLREMVDDVMVMMKAEAGQLALDHAHLDLAPVLEKVITQVRPLLDSKILNIGFHLNSELPPILGDGYRLEHALRNLLTNSIAYTERGMVMVNAWAEPHALKLTIEDSDLAIEVDKLDNFFEWNWRKLGKHSFCRRGAAFDLGVVISKKLIEMHGGTLTVTAQAMHGLTFNISLPLEM